MLPTAWCSEQSGDKLVGRVQEWGQAGGGEVLRVHSCPCRRRSFHKLCVGENSVEMASQKDTVQVSNHMWVHTDIRPGYPTVQGWPLETALIHSWCVGLGGDGGENIEIQGPLRR